MLAPVINILPLTTIRKERVLPVPGRIIARQGQDVAPRDIVAEANLSPEHLLLNISQNLGVSKSQANGLIQREKGDDVNEGDLIAGPVGIFRRVVRTPVSGQVVLVGSGQVLIQVDKPLYGLRAGIPGMVTQLIPDRGVVIETTGALIQGVWGNDQVNFGLMQSKVEKLDDVLAPDDLDISLRGTIVLGGHCNDSNVLRKASEIPLRGLILSSMSSKLIPHAEKLEIPILVLEGFGMLPFNEISFNLITSHSNREVAVNAEPFDQTKGTRPEVIIPLPTNQEPSPPLMIEDFSKDQIVKILRPPFAGKTGTIQKVFTNQIEFPSGVRALGAMVDINSGESVKIPLANLEVVG